ncbi:MAG TPA: RluA family pseudouridine synthase [Candidatus Acidoferrales bacterium]|nr:RluA family pseudouridine synthase [Candidatus Acidoferrales bacterium]
MPRRTSNFSVPVEARGQRLDHFLATELTQLSRSQLQKCIRDGGVTLDGKEIRRASLRLRGGEKLAVVLPEPPASTAVPEEIPLDVLYEDDDLAVLNKPAGLVVHAGAGPARRGGTLVNALLHRFRRLSAIGGPLRPGIVHRLDKPTSGVLLIAKTDEAHLRLAALFERREVEKRYLALAHGRLARAHDVIRLPVARDLARRTRMTTRRRQGRAAITEYRVLETARGFTLLEALLHTGRTHQVRVHFSSLGHPLVGDTLYGAPRLLRWDDHSEPTLDRIFLHARQLRFLHPRTEKPVEVSAPVPAKLSDLLRRLGFAYNG